MNFSEWLGSTVQAIFCSTGATVFIICLFLGARELLRRVRGERRVVATHRPDHTADAHLGHRGQD